MKQLEAKAITHCYEKEELNIDQAEACENFLYENDYKLKKIKSFWGDHITKHLNEYSKCADEAF